MSNSLAGLPIIPTTLVGSYAPPEWLVDVDLLRTSLPQRVEVDHLWKVEPDALAAALDAATVAAVGDQARAGINIITDGEVRRVSYSARFSNALGGIDRDNHGTTVSRTGATVAVPRIVGPIHRADPVEVESAEFVHRVSPLPQKVTLPGPFTMAALCQDDYYDDPAERAHAYAAAVREEIIDLFAAGVAMVQLDEPYLQARLDDAHAYGADAINAALSGIEGRTVVHTCFGYGQYVKEKPDGYPYFAELTELNCDDLAIEAAQPGLNLSRLTELAGKNVQLGVIDCGSHKVESAEDVATMLRAALQYVAPENLVAATDCGMKYLPRNVSFRKLQSLAQGAAMVRAEIS